MAAPNEGRVHAARRAVLAVVVLLAACGRPGAPLFPQQRPLDPAAQRMVAEKVARGFAEVCLPATDALATTRALQAQGWPAFALISDLPGNLTYTAQPTAASPASLSVIMDPRRGEPARSDLTCVAHYPAASDALITQAIERRWGASHDGPISLSGSRAWTFRMENGALTSLSSSGAADGPVTKAALAGLHGGQALVYAEVFNQPVLNDVTSVVTVWRPAP